MAKQPDRTAAPKPSPVEIILDEAQTDTLRPIGGSRSDRFNNALIGAMASTGWFPTGQRGGADGASSPSPKWR
jgi:hypothetical protein